MSAGCYLALYAFEIEDERRSNVVPDSCCVKGCVDLLRCISIFHHPDKRGPNSSEKEKTDSIVKMGALIRLIGKGGEAYLPTDNVRQLMNSFRIHGSTFCQWSEIEPDLNIFKDYALGCAAPLLKNESMLGPDVRQFKHLTCTKVERNEFPWYEPEEQQ